MGVRPGDVAHVTLSYHVMPGGLRLHRAFEEAGCLVINGGTGASRLQVAGRARLRRDGLRRHAELPREPRRHGARDGPRSADATSATASASRRPRRSRRRCAAICRRHLRHRALRPLRRGADRPARRRVPRARGHAPPRARSLLRVPRSRRPASRSGRASVGELVATQLGPARAAARALRAARRVPPARRARARAATRRSARRLRRAGGRHQEDQGRPRPPGAGARGR